MLFHTYFAVVGAKNTNRRGGDPHIEKHSEERKEHETRILQNFKVGDQALPKDVIDAIMAENGKDGKIMMVSHKIIVLI